MCFSVFFFRNKLSTSEIRDNMMRHAKFTTIEANKSTYLDLFRTWDLRLRTIFSFIVWFAVGLIYYGISQYVTFVGSDIYIATAILGLIQVPNFYNYIVNTHSTYSR